ncbi:MAG: 3-methyl-2-oxobutanoate hydroxymethyltransferase [Alphaproteobacteria bacterium]
MADKPTKLSIFDVQAKVARGEPVFQVTAVDFPTAQLVDRAGVDFVLVGDSLGMTALGYTGTVPVTMDEMLHHAKAITRAVRRAIVVGDMPFGAYHGSTRQAIDNAVRLLKEGGCDVVKLEGGEDFAPMAAAVIRAGIPVMGHIGLTPQLVSKLGGFKVQGKDVATSLQLIRDAEALEDAGCFAIVLEAIPDRIAQLITERLSIPTIGIGAGPHCSGQNLVLHDMVGLFERFVPKFVKRYVNVSEQISAALEEFQTDVREGSFPQAEHSFTIKDEEYEAVLAGLEKSKSSA